MNKSSTMKNHSKDCSTFAGGMCDCGKEKPCTLEIKDFPENIKTSVQILAIQEHKTFKRLTTELFQRYLTEKGVQ